MIWAQTEMLLVSVAGPTPVQQRLERGRPLSVGRRATHGLILERPEVSRDHAEFRPVESPDGVRWMLVDLGSRHKTRVNGQELRPGEPCPVQAGDLIEIAPWTLRLVEPAGAGGSSSRERQVRTVDDDLGASNTLRTISAAAEELAKERLRLLLSFAEAMGSAADEAALARAVIDAAVRGTGFPNVAVLRPLMPDGTVSIIADTGEVAASGEQRSLRPSRSLIRQASLGQPVQVGGDMMVVPAAHSIVDLRIQEAMCVPLMLEGAAAGFLYLDAREPPGSPGPRRSVISSDAGAFAAGLARLAAMALLNLMRRDLEKRYARMEGEIAAAASAQQLILPAPDITMHNVRILGQCRPGRIVSGDFFDVIPLRHNRVAVALGDVAGKGVQASVLMTTTQGFLHGVLAQHGDPRRAVIELNNYLVPRCDSGRFLSLWLGVIDARPGAGSIEYVNAGHGYAWLLGRTPGSGARKLNNGGGPLVGVLEELPYQSATVEFNPGDRLLLLSDGIIEQPRAGDREQPFEWDGVQLALEGAASPEDMMASLFEAVYAHAAQPALADDATVVLAAR